MDLATSIIALVLVGICVSPFMIMGLKKVKNKKQQFQNLSRLANENNLTIGQYDVFGNLSIGIDSKNNQLLFFRNDKNHNKIEQCVDISNIKNCSINKTGTKDVIKQIELCLHTIIKNQQEINLLFFDNQTEFQLNGQLQLAEKWKNIIQKQLN